MQPGTTGVLTCPINLPKRSRPAAIAYRVSRFPPAGIERGVNENTAVFAALAGIWHDLGKYRPGFQAYIRAAGDVDAHIENKVPGREKTHSAAGALWSEQHLAARMGERGRIVARVLQYLIAGHHAGLDNWHDGLASRLLSILILRERLVPNQIVGIGLVVGGLVMLGLGA